MKKVVIIGGGFFGCYIADKLLNNGLQVEIYEQGQELFMGASRVNQARLHMGYHYPRSEITVKQSLEGFDKFIEEFPSAINDRFDQLYAVSNKDSFTSANEYLKFCDKNSLPYEIIHNSKYFDLDEISLVLKVREYSFDWLELSKILENRIKKSGGAIHFNSKVVRGDLIRKELIVDSFGVERVINFDKLINCSYSSINQINVKLGVPPLKLTYELSEMIKIKLPREYSNIGVTIMDGKFMSVMPYGNTGYHTIWHVRRSLHEVSNQILPKFTCNSKNEVQCSRQQLDICLKCPLKPNTSFNKAVKSAKKYIPWIDQSKFEESLITVKVIKSNVESTDERPSLIVEFEEYMDYYVILSGKLDAAIQLSNQLLEKLLISNV